MMLSFRMVLYFLFASLASHGFVVFDQIEGTVTFQIEHLAMVGTGVVGYLGTFFFSRVAKARGGQT